MKYGEAKAAQLDAASTYRIYGEVLETEEPGTSKGNAARRIPIVPCLCVHDSPDSPCPCMHEPSWDGVDIWWLDSGAIVRRGKSGRKSHGGKELEYFDARTDSSITVESVQTVNVGALKRLEGATSPEAVRELMSSGSTSSPGVAYGLKAVLDEIVDTVIDMGKFYFGAIDFKAMEEWAKEQAEKQKPS